MSTTSEINDDDRNELLWCIDSVDQVFERLLKLNIGACDANAAVLESVKNRIVKVLERNWKNV